MQTKIMTIDPNTADVFLSMNTKNRPLNLTRSKRIAEAIKRGEWQLNGDAIRISKSGVLLDGQHRLMAIKLSGMSVESFVITGLEDEVFKTIDTNAKARGAADIFAINGEKNSTSLAASALLLFFYRKNNVPFKMSPADYATPIELQSIVEENPDLRNCVNFSGSSSWCRKYVTQTVTGFCLFVFREKNEQKGTDFFELLETGAGLHKNSPILVLRNRLIMESSDKNVKISQKYKVSLIFKSFKHFLAGDEIKQLRVPLENGSPARGVFVL